VESLLNCSPPEPEEAKFRNRLVKQRRHLLACLEEPAAKPTNNRAERDLRPAVIDRKLSCGNRTLAAKRAKEMTPEGVALGDHGPEQARHRPCRRAPPDSASPTNSTGPNCPKANARAKHRPRGAKQGLGFPPNRNMSRTTVQGSGI
jgi:hypothetical protein